MGATNKNSNVDLSVSRVNIQLANRVERMSSSYRSGFGYQGSLYYLFIYFFTEFAAYSIILKQPSREIRARSFEPGRCIFENIIKRQPTHRLAKNWQIDTIKRANF